MSSVLAITCSFSNFDLPLTYGVEEWGKMPKEKGELHCDSGATLTIRPNLPFHLCKTRCQAVRSLVCELHVGWALKYMYCEAEDRKSRDIVFRNNRDESRDIQKINNQLFR